MKNGRTAQDIAKRRIPFAVQLFLALTLFEGVPLLLFGLWASQDRTERAEQQFDQLGLQQATDARDAVLSTIGLKEEVVSIVAATVAMIDDWSGEALQPLVNNQFESSGSFDALLVSDREGTSVAFAPSVRPDGSLTSTGVSYRDRQYYKDLIRTRKTSYGPLVRGKQSRVPNIHVAVPIFSPEADAGDDKLRGLVVASIRTALLHEVAVRAIPARDGRRVVIIDNAGQVVVDSHNKIQSMESATQLPYSPLDCGAKGVDTADESGLGQRATCAPMSLGAQNWVVWISAPRSLIDMAASEAKYTIFQVTLLMWLCGLALSAAVSIQFGKWVSRFTQVAQQVGSGDFEIQVANTSWHHPREAENLRDVFLQTTDRLRDNEANVKALVDELTTLNKRLQPYADAWTEVTDAIEILDSEAKVMFVNPAFAALTGRKSNVVGRLSPLHTPSRQGDTCVPDLLKHAQEGQPWQACLQVEVDGRDRVHEVHLTPILDDTGRILRIVAIRSDVTAVRIAQAAASHNDHLVALGTLATGLAHEINNPLTYIRTSLEMVHEQHRDRAGRPNAEPQVTQSVQDAIEGVEKVTRIVQDMLSLTQTHETDIKSTKLETIPLGNVVQATLDLTRASTCDAVRVQSIVDPTLKIRASRHETIKLLLNLIRNAVQALETTPFEDSQITIRAGQDEAHLVWLEIIDNGPGIDPTKLNRIFEPFYTSRGVGKGVGMGLSTSRSIVRSMGGTLTVSSRPGHTCFKTTFVAPATSQPTLPSSPSDLDNRKARILVIDDDPRVARSIKLMLRNHDVTLAEDGSAALDLVRKNRYDLIICDVMMPVMDGPAVYENMKSTNPMACERLVFLTGAATNPHTHAALHNTGRQILGKPTNRKQLEELVDHFHSHLPPSA
ncbi:MAG: response regulator [Rhodobacterales bacterium]|nr:response regulator [Rhodobacterales bacterium]